MRARLGMAGAASLGGNHLAALRIATTAASSPSTTASSSSSSSSCTSPLPVVAARGIKIVQPIGVQGVVHYSEHQKFSAGVDSSIKMTEFYDGYTDDFGTYKDGPPQTIRLEYLRSPEHMTATNIHHRFLWSPFEAPMSMRTYTPLYYDASMWSSRDYQGHRNGPAPGTQLDRMGSYYRRDEMRRWETRVAVNRFPQLRIPKWLATIVHDKHHNRFVAFFLYANGSYCAELLTYKQIPRLTYNKPYNGCMPTIGQAIQLSEVTYGKEVSQVEWYPGYGGAACNAAGTAAVVLRGTEPGLVPLLLPSKEVRLFELTSQAVFGRNAGVMQRQTNLAGHRALWMYKWDRPRVAHKRKQPSEHQASGGNGYKRNLLVQIDYREFPAYSQRTKYWLSGYILRGRQYTKRTSAADLKTKTYSWASRDPVYR